MSQPECNYNDGCFCSDPNCPYPIRLVTAAAPAPQAELTVEFSKPNVDNVDFYAPAGMVVGAAPAETARPEPASHICETDDDIEGNWRCSICGKYGNPAAKPGGETAGEMTAEQFYDTLPEETKYKWVNKVRPHWAFDFANAFAKQRVEQVERLLRDLLAVIHRDGGHNTAEFGLETSAHQAESIARTQQDLKELYLRQAQEAEAKVADLERELDKITLELDVCSLAREVHIKRATAAESELREMREALTQWVVAHLAGASCGEELTAARRLLARKAGSE